MRKMVTCCTRECLGWIARMCRCSQYTCFHKPPLTHQHLLFCLFPPSPIGFTVADTHPQFRASRLSTRLPPLNRLPPFPLHFSIPLRSLTVTAKPVKVKPRAVTAAAVRKPAGKLRGNEDAVGEERGEKGALGVVRGRCRRSSRICCWMMRAR